MAVVVLVVVLTLALPWVLPGVPWDGHITCEQGDVVAQVRLDTPLYAVDSPPGGWANTTLTSQEDSFSSGGLVLTSSSNFGPSFASQTLSETLEGGNGSVEVDYWQNASWSIYSVHNQSVIGAGGATPCTAPYVASAALGSQAQVDSDWQGPGNVSDQGVPHQDPKFNSSGGAPGSEPALLDLRPQAGTPLLISNCGVSVSPSHPTSLGGLLGVHSIPFGIPFMAGGTSHVVWGSVEWTNQNGSTITYDVAANGEWTLETTPGGAASPFGVDTFSYTACS